MGLRAITYAKCEVYKAVARVASIAARINGEFEQFGQKDVNSTKFS